MYSGTSKESSNGKEPAGAGRQRSNSMARREALILPAQFDGTNTGGGSISSSSSEKVESKMERSNLTERELKALRKGLEEATYHRDRDSIREEEEEKRAADAEKKIRNASTLIIPSKIGIEPPMKKFKILMLGDSGVGKSSLINRWTADTFSPTLVGTVGVDFKAKKVQFGSEQMNVQVWDTAGQEQFHKITTSYYKGANGIMLVYDVSDLSSFGNVEYWIKNIKLHASEHVHIALIGNKIDLRSTSDNSTVSFEQGHSLAMQFSVPYFETSAKDATNVESAFCTVVSSIAESDKKKEASVSPKRSSIKSIAEKAQMHQRAAMKHDEKCALS